MDEFSGTDLFRFPALRVGMVLPELAVTITRADLIRFAGAADDYVPQHWDHPMMVAAGFADVVVHGWLCFAHMCRCVTDWAPPRIATIAAYEVTYRRPLYPGLLTCGGTVAKTAVHAVALDLWARDAGEQTVTRASVELAPIRA